MLLVQLWINSTRDVWKFAKLDSPRRLVQFWQNFQKSLVLLISNCTRHRHNNPPPHIGKEVISIQTNECMHDVNRGVRPSVRT